MDTNIDDQVEQLGLWTRLRLDVKHMIVPPKNSLDSDFSALGGLGDGSSSSDGSTSAGDTSAEEPSRSLTPRPT